MGAGWHLLERPLTGRTLLKICFFKRQPSWFICKHVNNWIIWEKCTGFQTTGALENMWHAQIQASQPTKAHLIYMQCMTNVLLVGSTETGNINEDLHPHLLVWFIFYNICIQSFVCQFITNNVPNIVIVCLPCQHKGGLRATGHKASLKMSLGLV